MNSIIKSQEYSSEYDSDSSSFVSYSSNEHDNNTVGTIDDEEMEFHEDLPPDEYYMDEYETETLEYKKPSEVYKKVDTSIPKINPWNKKENSVEMLQCTPSFSMADIVKSQMVEKEQKDKMKRESAKKRAKFQFHSRSKPDNHKSLLLKSSSDNKTTSLKR